MSESDWFRFVLGALATYRLSVLTSKEAGPGFIFRKLRRAPSQKKHPAIKEGLSCPLCVSMYYSAMTVGYYKWLDWIDWSWTPIYWLALSATAVILHMKFTKDL